MGASVLQAMKDQDSSLAMNLTREGGDLLQRDDYGNLPLHYAAALGYLPLIEEFLLRGVPVDSKNHSDQTPLVYAMMYNQYQAAQMLWRRQRETINQATNPFANVVLELISIGVDRTFPPEEASSGFYQLDSPLKSKHHPRVEEIGRELNAMGGMVAMTDAYQEVRLVLGGGAARDLEICWGGIGEWEP